MPSVAPLFGPMLIGTAINILLYGIMLTQMFTYHHRYTADAWWIRLFMVYLLLIETAVVVIEFGIVYQPLVLEFGSLNAVINFPTLLPGDALLIALVSCPIQLFTAWRIKVISSSYVLPAIICFLSIGSFGLGITTGIRVFLIGQFARETILVGTTTTWLATTCVCDVVIAVGMTHALLSRKTGFKQVDSQINRIVRLSVETGSLTAAAAVIDLALAVGIKSAAANFIVDFPLSTIYTCSVLALLNSREPNNPALLSGSRDAERNGRSLQLRSGGSSSGNGGSGGMTSPPASYALGNMGSPRERSNSVRYPNVNVHGHDFEMKAHVRMYGSGTDQYSPGSMTKVPE
ncbi:hypothetical protein HMN09_01176000 [Mycena chlorophos]|uniref:DUF6534 domain-containing protein n=1 Tax=Mycena chlorophos TaxID=658473 RepID=A0A8H6S8L7_MYCCL|nr:hypothetical protein HMN09_01176000 [Mycena chlorophos]